MADKIPNFGASIPKKFRGEDVKTIESLDIKSLFRMVILGPSYSGKNNLVLYMLKNSPHVFSHLHIIARNRDQPIYDYIADQLKEFVSFYDAESIPLVDQIRKTPRKGIELVIIDDFSNDMKLQENVFSHYFTRGRHHRLSTVFLSHSWFKTAKMIRLNSEYCAILRANSKRDLQMILKDFNVDLSESQFYEAYRRATSDKGQALFIDSVQDQVRYNFNKVVDKGDL